MDLFDLLLKEEGKQMYRRNKTTLNVETPEQKILVFPKHLHRVAVAKHQPAVLHDFGVLIFFPPHPSG